MKACPYKARLLITMALVDMKQGTNVPSGFVNYNIHLKDTHVSARKQQQLGFFIMLGCHCKHEARKQLKQNCNNRHKQ